MAAIAGTMAVDSEALRVRPGLLARDEKALFLEEAPPRQVLQAVALPADLAATALLQVLEVLAGAAHLTGQGTQDGGLSAQEVPATRVLPEVLPAAPLAAGGRMGAEAAPLAAGVRMGAGAARLAEGEVAVPEVPSGAEEVPWAAAGADNFICFIDRRLRLK